MAWARRGPCCSDEIRLDRDRQQRPERADPERPQHGAGREGTDGEQQTRDGQAGGGRPEGGRPAPAPGHPVAGESGRDHAQGHRAEVEAGQGVAKIEIGPQKGHDRPEARLQKGEQADRAVGEPGGPVADEGRWGGRRGERTRRASSRVGGEGERSAEMGEPPCSRMHERPERMAPARSIERYHFAWARSRFGA